MVKPFDNMVFKIVVLAVFFIISYFVFNLTKVGRRQKFIGGNPVCAALTGIESNKYTIIAIKIFIPMLEAVVVVTDGV